MLGAATIRYLDDLIVYTGIEDAWHEPSTNALNLVRAGAATRQHCALRRLNCHDLEVFLDALQVLTTSRDGAARADPRNQDINLPLRVTEDLWAGSETVDGSVGRVFELLQHKGVFSLGCDLLRFLHGAPHPLGRVGQHKRSAKGLRRQEMGYLEASLSVFSLPA